MASVNARPNLERLHGSVEMIEDSSQSLPIRDQKHEVKDKKHSGGPGLAQDTSMYEKDDIVVVTVNSLDSRTQGSCKKDEADGAIEDTPPVQNDQRPTVNRAASRRYSMMMASLAASRVEESKANLRKSSLASPGSTGVPVGTAIGGWEWRTRRDREDDYSAREKYFADEL